MMSNDRDSTSSNTSTHWTTLWKAGVLHSCSHGITDNYDAEIGDFWRRILTASPHAARVLDVGTGNGPILLLARSLREDLDLQGVDLADIDPVASLPDGAARLAGVRFHPRTPMESLPMADHSIDLLTSQYAFEYGPREETLAEFARVLRPDGRIAMILHSTDSEIARVSALQLDACARVLDDDGTFDRAQALVATLTAAVSEGRLQQLGADPAAERTRHAFNASAQALLDAAMATPEATVLERAAHILRSALGIASQEPLHAAALLESGRDQIRAERERLREFQAAAQSADGMSLLQQMLAALGHPVQFTPLDYRGQRMGWQLESARG